MNDFFYQMYRQIKAFYGFLSNERKMIEQIRPVIVERFANNCSHLSNKYYLQQSSWTPLHVGQYTIFLYYVSNTLYRSLGHRSSGLSSKIYSLLRMVSGCDLFYQIELPKVFMVEHPIGTVLGRAKYGERIGLWQGVTVGGNRGCYPKIGDDVLLLSHAKVLGKSVIGNRVIVSANAYIKDAVVPDDSIVFGSDRQLVIKSLSRELACELFGSVFRDWAHCRWEA